MAEISNPKNKKVLVALSGGVDSSVASALLKKQGYKVEAAFMRCWSKGPHCSVERDQTDAGRVAAILGITFHVFDFEKEYKSRVIDYFFAEYAAGRTPNPDIMCNKEIKFGLFLDKAIKMGFDYIATGHYARVKNSVGYHLLAGKDKSKDQSLKRFKLLAGLDREKDQSYFLFRVGQDQLAKTLFPLGDITKKEVRRLAKKFGLPTADKKESMGICFIGPADIREFLRTKIKIRHGDIVDLEGRGLGRHIGLAFYTIGQREGLGISQALPYYVVEKDNMKNRLVVAPFGHNSLFKKEFVASSAHWVAGKEPMFPIKSQAKLRYRAKNIEVSVNKAGKSLNVMLEKPQRAITPGQSVVFYKDKEVIGGVVIDNVTN